MVALASTDGAWNLQATNMMPDCCLLNPAAMLSIEQAALQTLSASAVFLDALASDRDRSVAALRKVVRCRFWGTR